MTLPATPASALIERFGLAPHPEGGWYREIHRSAESVNTPRGTRSAMTTIYYLLERGQLSRWHVVSSDEIWHFYSGAPLELLVYEPRARALTRHALCTPSGDQMPVGVVPAGAWQAARSLDEWSLVGCSVGPGFDFADFRFIAALPDHAAHFTGEMAKHSDLI
jgi:uncharacterized protein